MTTIDNPAAASPIEDEEKVIYSTRASTPSEPTAIDDQGIRHSDYRKKPNAPLTKSLDGGLEAWVVVVGAWCASFCTFGWINSLGVFQDYYSSTLLNTYSPSSISWILSMALFFMLGMSPVVGKIYDSYGPRYLVFVGTPLHVFGLMMASISTEYYQILLSQGVCSGIGMSAIFWPSLTSIGSWFTKNRGLAYGVTVTGSSLGGVIFPIMVNRLILEVGFGWALRISAFIILALLIVTNLSVQSRNTPKATAVSWRDFIYPFKEIPISLTVFGNFLFVFGWFIPLSYIVVAATQQGMSHDLAEYLVPILNAASLFGRVFAGMLADRIGQFNVFIIVDFLTGVLTLALWIPATNNASTIAFAVLWGFFSGAYISLTPAVVAQISPPEQIGVRTGLTFAVASIAGLASDPIGGAMLSNSSGDFTGVKVFAGVMCLVGTLFVIFARIAKTGCQLVTRF